MDPFQKVALMLTIPTIIGFGAGFLLGRLERKWREPE